MPPPPWRDNCLKRVDDQSKVTARERAWYTFFAVNDVKQPSVRDVPQPIGAGAMVSAALESRP